MLSQKKSLSILKRTNALLEGHFVLSSGLHSSKYIQCAKLLSFPHLANEICQSLSQKLKENFKKIDLILAPAMGGIIIGYEIGKLLKKETIFCERVKGKSSLECVKLIKKSKAKILGFACIINRSSKNNLKIKKKIISHLKITIPTYKKNKLPNYLKSTPISIPGSRFVK